MSQKTEKYYYKMRDTNSGVFDDKVYKSFNSLYNELEHILLIDRHYHDHHDIIRYDKEDSISVSCKSCITQFRHIDDGISDMTW